MYEYEPVLGLNSTVKKIDGSQSLLIKKKQFTFSHPIAYSSNNY